MTRRRAAASRRALRLAIGTAFCASGAWADLTADQTPFNSFRGVWVDRFDYNVAQAQTVIPQMMTNLKNLGFTDVMFQVRGRADAFYFDNDGVEVHASGVTAANDPLGLAVQHAHANGLKLHAWINTMPLWQAQSSTNTASGYTPNAPANHLINQHPEYWIRNSANQPLQFPVGSTGYVIVNPARPDVRDHINDVANTIASNYAIDGLHLDYIRLYNSNPGANNVLEYPADPFTVSLFQQQYPGQTPTSNPANFKAFMADSITTLVRSLRDTVKGARPDAQLTAAVWRDADIGLDEYQQDWARWIDQGLLDAAMPMIYRKGFGTGGAGMNSDSGDLYRNNVAEAMGRRGTAGIMVGLGPYMQDDPSTAYANTMAQLEYAKAQGANGVQIFDISSFTGTGAVQTAVRNALTDFFAANSAVVPVAPLAEFEGGEGSFKWSLTQSGSNVNVLATSTADHDATTARTGTGSQKIVINRGTNGTTFLARHLSGNGATPGTAATFDTNTPFVSIGSIGFWLKTTSLDLQVAVALDDPGTGNRSYLQNVIADGQWHRYEWFLADPTHWDAWIAGAAGHLANVTALDSIQFFGTGDTNTIFLDDVFHNPSAVAANQWTFDVDAGTWNNAGHWTGGVPNGIDKTANLLRRATTNRAVVLDAPVTLGTLNFDNAQSYALTGTNALSLEVSGATAVASVNVFNRGAHTIGVPLNVKDNAAFFVDRGSRLVLAGAVSNATSKTLTKTGDGVLEIAGPQAHGVGSSLMAAGGVTRLLSDGGANLAVSATAAARVEFAASQNLASIALRGSAAASITPGASKSVFTRGLQISPGATFDLADGALIQEYTPGVATSPVAIARMLIQSGALLSSSAANGSQVLGYGQTAELLGISGTQTASLYGRTVDPTAVVMRLTLLGDADLDGAVDFEDLVRLAQSYDTDVSPLTASWWTRGDFTHDGMVDFNDMVALAQNYNASLPAGAFAASFEAAWDEARASVPEPGGVVGVFGAMAMSRRRHRGRARP